MKKTILIASLAIGTFLMASCGSTKCIEVVQSSDHSYIDDVDDHGNITYSEVIEVGEISAEDLFTRAHTFFVYNYNSATSVIQQSDKDRGLIIGKGLWSDFQVYRGIEFSAYHILRVDAKNGRARITITVQSIDYVSKDSKGNLKDDSYNPANIYPFVEVPKIKRSFNLNACTAIALRSKCENLIDRLENDILHGSTSKSIENEGW